MGDIRRPHFVWIKGPNGPQPQKWGELDYGVGNHKRADVVGSPVELSDVMAALPLDELAKLYPAPKY